MHTTTLKRLLVTRSKLLLALWALLLLTAFTRAGAQGTAFTYQGRLNDGVLPANGSYDLKFTLLDTPAGGGPVAEPVTNAAVAVAGGLFTVTLDFGQSPFTGAERWLELGVCTNAAGAFTTLAPRQKLTATPYALLAGETTSTNVARLDVPNTATPATAVPILTSGFIVGANILSPGNGYTTPPTVTVTDATGSGAMLSATVAGGKVMALNVNNAGSGYSAGTTITIGAPPSNAYQVFPGVNQFDNSGNTFAGSFTGNGAGLTGLNASQLTTGTVPDARMAGTYSGALNFNNPANEFTGSGAGLTQLNASQLASGTVSDARLDANVARTNQVWLLGGNAGTTPGMQFLGTSDNQPLELMVNGQRALRLEPNSYIAPNVIGGAAANSVAPGVVSATIGGGGQEGYYSNRVESSYGTVGGGADNRIQAGSLSSTIGGGYLNTIQNSSHYASILGGHLNSAGAQYAAIGGGYANTIQANATWATISGGRNNTIQTNASHATVGGGYSNTIQTNANYATIAGGGSNQIETNSTSATIAGGYDNTIRAGAVDGSIGGGWSNTIETNAIRSTISGGSFNLIAYYAAYSAIGGGYVNTIEPHGDGATIGGGTANTNGYGADYATIGGGRLNRTHYDADYASIGGGYRNTIQTNSDHATIAGGGANLIESNATSATIAGGYDNTIQASAVDGSIGGGWFNTIETSAIRSTISGGSFNLIAKNAGYSAIGGGYANSIQTNAGSATIAGGYQNTNHAGSATIGGGNWNSVETNAIRSTIGGGGSNLIQSDAYDSTIGGGLFNSIGANSYSASLGGGQRNAITGSFGTIPGGVWNSATNYALAAGFHAKANHTGAFVWADTTGGDFSSTAANQFNVRASGGVRLQTGGAGVTLDGQPLLTTGSQLTGLNASQLTSGTVPNARLSGTYSSALNFNNPANTFAGSGAGLTSLNADLLDGLDSSDFATASHNHDLIYAKQGGNAFGAPLTLGTTDNQPFEIKANNQRAFRLEPNASGAPNVIGGASINVAGAGVVGATIAGGGATDFAGRAHTNAVWADFGTVGGGAINTIHPEATSAAIGGGYGNTIQTKASHPTIGGGYENTIQESADYATIPGGKWNSATNYAFAAGYRAKANHTGAFVWGDSTDADFGSTATDQFSVRASGGYRLFSDGGASTGVSLAAGSGSWTSMSDRNAKENIAPVDAQAVLDKVAALPLTTWNYKSQDSAVRHLGPMAQDFKAAFGLGETDTGITSVDADGVALAAIQGLNQKLEDKLQQKETEITELRKTVLELKELVSKFAAQQNGGAR